MLLDLIVFFSKKRHKYAQQISVNHPIAAKSSQSNESINCGDQMRLKKSAFQNTHPRSQEIDNDCQCQWKQAPVFSPERGIREMSCIRRSASSQSTEWPYRSCRREAARPFPRQVHHYENVRKIWPDWLTEWLSDWVTDWLIWPLTRNNLSRRHPIGTVDSSFWSSWVRLQTVLSQKIRFDRYLL